LLRWRAWIRAGEGQYEDAFDDIKACYRLGRHLKGNKTIIEQLVGISIENLAIQTLLGVVSEHKIDSTILALLQKDFDEMITDDEFMINLDVAKFFTYDAIQRCFTQERFGSGHIIFEAVMPLLFMEGSGSSDHVSFEEFLTTRLHILFTHPNKQQTIDMADCYYAFWDSMSQKTPGQLHSEEIDIEKEAAKIIKGNILLEIMKSTIHGMYKLSYRNKTNVEANLVIIAILRYNQVTGHYPDNLQQLVTAGFLKKLPMDAYSDNKPFVYKKTEDSFVLYSVGLNFTDDGGRVVRNAEGKIEVFADEGDWVFWPVQD